MSCAQEKKVNVLKYDCSLFCGIRLCVYVRARICVCERERESCECDASRCCCQKKEIIHKLETYELRMNVWVCIYGDSCSFWYMNNGSLKWTHEQKFSHFCRMKNWSILLEQECDGVGRGKKDRVKRKERERVRKQLVLARLMIIIITIIRIAIRITK